MVKYWIAAAVSMLASPAAANAIPSRPDADPAIWVVNDHDTTIYLFGTFHALDGRSEWFNEQVRTAFSLSNELVLETVVPETRPGWSFAPVRDRPRTASSPFLASTRMAIAAGRSLGLKTEQGADTILRRAANAEGKPVGGLESFEFQLGMFAQMPAARPGPVRVDYRGLGELSATMAHLQEAWNRGDQRLIAAMLDQMRTGSPESYRRMFAERNSKWADWIARRLDSPGTVFMAVGAGHLAGADSVQAKLADRGVPTSRIG